MDTIFGVVTHIKNNNYASVKPIAFVKDNKFVDITDARSLFPNNGKVFHYNQNNSEYVGKLGIYNYRESPNYNDEIPVSSKYVISNEITNLPFLEIIEIHSSFQDNQDEIKTVLKEGFGKTHDILTKVIFLTKDDYLIGPFSLKSNGSDRWTADLSNNDSVEVRINKADIIDYFDIETNKKRLYTTIATINLPILTFLDCSSNETIVREALKILKEVKNSKEISRKVIKMLSDLVRDESPRIKKDKILKAITILDEYHFSDSEMEILEDSLLSNEQVKQAITKEIEKTLKLDRKSLLEQHKNVINETNYYSTIRKNLKNEIDILSSRKELVEKEINKLEQALENRINQMEDNIYEAFANLLPGYNKELNNNDQRIVKANQTSTQWYTKEQEVEVEIIETNEIIEAIINNLEKIEVDKEVGRLMAITTIGCIIFRKPLVIYGENSYDIAQILGWSLAGNDHICVYPDIKNYSNEVLKSIFENNYHSFNKLKAVHISSIESSSAELYLPSLINYWSVSLEKTLPELMIFSVNEIDQLSEDFRINLKHIPFINTNGVGIKGKLRKVMLKEEMLYGFVTAKDLLSIESTLNNKTSEFADFMETIESETKLTRKMIKDAYKDWFRLLETYINSGEELVAKWMVETFIKSFVSSDEYQQILHDVVGESVNN